MYLSGLQHSQLALKYSDRMGDADKVGLFLSETNNHLISDILHSEFCLLNDVSI